MVSLKGMYDLHVHAGPSIARRKFTALEALKLASDEGMAGLLLMDHTYNTEVVAKVLNEMGYSARLFGAILLNESVGGINPSVVETAIQLGTTHIQMPTYSSRHHEETIGDDQKTFPYRRRVEASYILDERGRLIQEVEDILQLLKGSGSFLGTGHTSAKEIEALVGRAKELKVRVLINGASNARSGIPTSIQKRLAGNDVYVEHDYGALVRAHEKKTPVESIVHEIREVGAERCVMVTDAGQIDYPDPVSGLRDFVKRLTENGITAKEIDLMTKENPRILLGIS